MFSAIITLTHKIWPWLPEVTMGLEFATALTGFCLTVGVTIQRLRHRHRHRRGGPTGTNQRFQA